MDSKDHDMLIKLDTKMSIMCKTLNKLSEDNAKAHKDIYELLDKKIDVTNTKLENKVDFKYFRILVGILITIGIIFTTTGVGHINTAYKDKLKMETCIEQIVNEQELTNHLYQIPTP